MKNLPFIKEITEARLFFGPKDIKDMSATEIAEIIFLMFMMIEVIRVKHKSWASNYASQTLKYNSYENMHYDATDLGNLIAVLNNQDTFKHDIKTASGVSIPLFQINRYLRSIASGNGYNSEDSRFFWQLEDYLKIYSNSLLRQLRRDISNWTNMSHSEKTQFILILRREFDKKSSSADIYLWFKSNFTLKESVNESEERFPDVIKAIRAVCPEVEEIWFHGSRAIGSEREDSDWDILALVPPTIDYLSAVKAITGLNKRFENFDIQPARKESQVYRIAQEEGTLLWADKQLDEAYSIGKMPEIKLSHYQEEYGKLLPKSTKIADVRKDISLFLYQNRIYMLVKDGKDVLGNVSVSEQTIAGKDYLHVDAIFVPKEYRKTSVLSWLLYAAKEQAHLPVIADGAIFSDGGDLIDSIIKHRVFNVSDLNVNTGQKSKLTQKINDSDHCYIFESAKLGFSSQIFENMEVTWLPLFEEIDTKLAYHDELNPELWESNGELKSDVKEALAKIANKFSEFVDINELKIVDYIITGSNCNYNYTSQSDIDIHVLVDASKLGDNPLTEPFLTAKKSLWNSGHNITVKGFDVELYAEDVNKEENKLVATGVYSLVQDKWLKKPEHLGISMDDAAVMAKAEDIMNQIDVALESGNADDLNRIREHIRKMRRAGLEAEGEFSVENLAFKAIRNNNYFDKMNDFERYKEDEELTLEYRSSPSV